MKPNIKCPVLSSQQYILPSIHPSTGVQECELPQQAVVTEVSVYRKDDQFKGLIVTLQDESQAPRLFEAFFTPVPFLKKFTFESELAKRILSLEVCTYL